MLGWKESTSRGATLLWMAALALLVFAPTQVGAQENPAGTEEKKGGDSRDEKKAVMPKAETSLSEEEMAYLKEKAEGPSQIYILTPRIRAITIPDFIFDAFLERHSSHWEDGPNLAYGLEFTLRKPTYDLVFAFEYADLSQPDNWFLEKDDPARKADWTTFPLALTSLTIGIQWFYEISDVFGLYMGAGLGAGLVIGEVEKTDPSVECIGALGDDKNADRLDEAPCTVNGEPQLDQTPGSTEVENRVPPVLPLINLYFGAQFTIYKNVVLKLDVGFNDYFYSGLSIGYQWW